MCDSLWSYDNFRDASASLEQAELTKALTVMEFGLSVHSGSGDSRSTARPATAHSRRVLPVKRSRRPLSAMPSRETSTPAQLISRHIAALCNRLADEKLAEREYSTAECIVARALEVVELGIPEGTRPNIIEGKLKDSSHKLLLRLDETQDALSQGGDWTGVSTAQVFALREAPQRMLAPLRVGRWLSDLGDLTTAADLLEQAADLSNAGSHTAALCTARCALAQLYQELRVSPVPHRPWIEPTCHVAGGTMMRRCGDRLHSNHPTFQPLVTLLVLGTHNIGVELLIAAQRDKTGEQWSTALRSFVAAARLCNEHVRDQPELQLKLDDAADQVHALQFHDRTRCTRRAAGIAAQKVLAGRRSKAARTLQAGLKGMEARRVQAQKHYEFSAASAIQRLVRGKQTRLHVGIYKYQQTLQALSMQSIVRGFLDRSNLRKKHRAARKIQVAFRATRLLRRVHQIYLNAQKASTKLGAVGRGFLGRQQVRAIRRFQGEKATILQCAFRQFAARKRLVTKRWWYMQHIVRGQRVIRSFLKRTAPRRRLRDQTALALHLQCYVRRRQAQRVYYRKVKERNIRMAVVIQRFVRGVLGKRAWVREKQRQAAVAIQSILRGHYGKSVEDPIRMFFKRIHTRMRFYMRWCCKRRAASQKIQKVMRGHASRKRAAWMVIQRREEMYRERIQARVEWMGVHLLGVARDRIARKEQAWSICHNHMNEIQRVLELECHLESDEHPHCERLAIAELLLANKRMLRKLFLKYTMILVLDPSKAFKMGKNQFMKFVRDVLKIKGSADMSKYDEVFTLANFDVEDGKVKVETTSDTDRYLQLDEFLDALLRLAALTFPDEPDPSDRLEAFFRDYLDAFSDVDVEPVQISELETEGTAVEGVLTQLRPRITKLYKYYAGEDEEVDAIEFMQIIKGSNLIDSNLSFAKVLEFFIRANQEEINEFLGENPETGGLEEMQMGLDEFIQGVVACASTKRKPRKTFAPLLEAFIVNLLENCKGKRF